MPDRLRMLRHSIAHFERLLRDGVDPDLADIYRAEVLAAKAMLEEIRALSGLIESGLEIPPSEEL